jgi:hypothetical protein
MGNSRNFKRRVRARMERTGESYQAAMHAMRQAQQHDAEVQYGRMTDAEVIAEYGPEVLGVPAEALERAATLTITSADLGHGSARMTVRGAP